MTNNKTIYQALTKTGGATLEATFHDKENYSLKVVDFKGGYQVSIEDLVQIPLQGEKINFRLDLNDLEWSETLRLLVLFQASKPLYEYSGVVCIGLWIDNGILYIDLSQYVGDKDIAIKLGKKHNQKAIFDWQFKESIYLD